MNFCNHPDLGNNARRDYCPLCKYEYYYGDAHATDPNLRLSKLINPGRDRKANGYPSEEEERYQEDVDRQAYDDYCAHDYDDY